MDYLTYLENDYRRLAEVVPGRLGAAVPSCPEWTVDDLVHHVGAVYLHKVECMRHNAPPKPWPPAGLPDEPASALLERAYAALVAEFAVREPSSPAYTWYPPDQTVGFWIRRMAQETVIHRIDGELGAGVESLTVPDELAVDGIDELLQLFVVWPSREWPEDFAEALGAGPGSLALTVSGPSSSSRWLVSWDASSGVTAALSDAGATAHAEISGTADAVLRWLWRRSDSGVTIAGDKAQVAQMRQILHAATQ